MATEDGLDLTGTVGARHHSVDEVGPIERADEHRRVAQPQLGRDVVPHAGRGGRGEGVDADVRKSLAEQGELAVLGTEVVAPLADAVSLVDREPPHAGAGEDVEQAGVHEPLRGHEQQPQVARDEPVPDPGSFARLEGSVDGRRRIADRLEGVDLILHEGDEGRDDHVGRAVHERRQLVAEALAPARRKHDERVTAREGGPEGVGLEGAQGVEAPPAREHVGDPRVVGGKRGSVGWPGHGSNLSGLGKPRQGTRGSTSSSGAQRTGMRVPARARPKTPCSAGPRLGEFRPVHGSPVRVHVSRATLPGSPEHAAFRAFLHHGSPLRTPHARAAREAAHRRW